MPALPQLRTPNKSPSSGTLKRAQTPDGRGKSSKAESRFAEWMEACASSRHPERVGRWQTGGIGSVGPPLSAFFVFERPHAHAREPSFLQVSVGLQAASLAILEVEGL